VTDWYFISADMRDVLPQPTHDGLTPLTGWWKGTNHSDAGAVDPSLMAPGDTLWLLDDHNRFLVDDLLQIALPDGVTVRGDYAMRPGTIRILSIRDSSTILVTALALVGGGLGLNNADDVTFDAVTVSQADKGFVVDLNNPADRCTIRNCTFHTLTHQGLEIFTHVNLGIRDGWVIEDNLIYNVGYDTEIVSGDREGIGLQRVTNTVVQRNEIYDCLIGINLWESGNGGSHDLSIDANHIHDIVLGPDHWPSRGIMVSGGATEPGSIFNITITNNTIDTIGKEGMRLQAPPDATGLVASGNIIGNVNTEYGANNSEFIVAPAEWQLSDNTFVAQEEALSITEGLILLYDLGEVSGSREDSIGSLHLDTLVGPPGSAAAIVGGGISFDGSQYAYNTGTAHPFAGLDEMTLSLWFKADAPGSGEQRLFNFLAGGTGNMLLRLLNTSGAITVNIRDDGGTSRSVTNGAASPDTWYHALVEYDRGVAISLTIDNGTAQTGTAIDSPIKASVSSPTTHLGALSGGTSGFSGILNQLAIWDRLLSSNEKAELFNSGAGTSLHEVVGGLTPGHSYQYRRLVGSHRSYSA
jgi:hypothetical protein